MSEKPSSSSSSPLTHFDAQGQAHMVDVGGKPATHRVAVASGEIYMKPTTADLVKSGTLKKGDVLGIARVAAIMAAKRTSEMVPLCHPIILNRIAIDFSIFHNHIQCSSTVETTGQTGVEIEALMAVQVALLTVYDMCKSADKEMSINNVILVSKSGGKTSV